MKDLLNDIKNLFNEFTVIGKITIFPVVVVVGMFIVMLIPIIYPIVLLEEKEWFWNFKEKSKYNIKKIFIKI